VIEAQDLEKTYDAGGAPALAGVSFCVQRGERLAIVGPSGSGKTTLLRVLAGLERPDAGAVRVDGDDVSERAPRKRGLVFLAQRDALFPHMSVGRNLRFAAAPDDRVAAIAALLEIDGLLERRPAQLSGGQRQRVAVARALLTHARGTLFDEPFAHLDPPVRVALRRRLTALDRETLGALIYVTHDHEDAMNVGDRVAVLIAGKIVQCDAPRAVYDAPATLDAARFLGPLPMNLIDGLGEELGFGPFILGVRAEHLAIDGDGEMRAQVERVELSGTDAVVETTSSAGRVSVRCAAEDAPALGARIGLRLDRSKICRYDRSTGARVA